MALKRRPFMGLIAVEKDWIIETRARTWYSELLHGKFSHGCKRERDIDR